MIPIELAGHGNRILDPPYRSFDEAVDDIISLIANAHLSGEFGIFGHSLGGILAYHVCQKMQSRGMKYPKLLFISAAMPGRATNLDLMSSDEQLVLQMKEIGGIPREIMDNEKLLKLYLPVIRRDLRLLDSAGELFSLPKPCRLVVLYGMKDEFCGPLIHKWKSFSSDCRFYTFSGDHFYWLNETERLFEVINSELYASSSRNG